jgi:hypothetical protein
MYIMAHSVGLFYIAGALTGVSKGLGIDTGIMASFGSKDLF